MIATTMADTIEITPNLNMTADGNVSTTTVTVTIEVIMVINRADEYKFAR